MSPRPATSRRRHAPALLLATLAAAPGAAQELGDAVMRMCSEGAEAAVCECAAERLEAEIGAEAYAVYEAVGAAYLERRADGQELGRAWDGALAETGAGLGDTNTYGRAHRVAIDACASGAPEAAPAP